MKILEFINPYNGLLTLALALGVVISVSVWFNGKMAGAREAGEASVRAEYALKLVEAKDAARVREIELTTQRDEAIRNANERDQTLRVLAAAASSSSNSLRDTLNTIRNSVPGATIETLRQSTATLATVLSECQGEYRQMAETADRHASDSQTLSDAYPTERKPPR